MYLNYQSYHYLKHQHQLRQHCLIFSNRGGGIIFEEEDSCRVAVDNIDDDDNEIWDNNITKYI